MRPNLALEQMSSVCLHQKDAFVLDVAWKLSLKERSCDEIDPRVVVESDDGVVVADSENFHGVVPNDADDDDDDAYNPYQTLLH